MVLLVLLSEIHNNKLWIEHREELYKKYKQNSIQLDVFDSRNE